MLDTAGGPVRGRQLTIKNCTSEEALLRHRRGGGGGRKMVVTDAYLATSLTGTFWPETSTQRSPRPV